MAAERFADAVLVEATDAGRTVALALFNRVRRRIGPSVLYLGESGNPEMDSPYVEQNGVLAAAGQEEELTERCLRAVASSHDLVLSGVGERLLAAVRRAAGITLVKRAQDSPFVDLGDVRRAGGDFLAGRSANTRQQIRRSDRFYDRGGAVQLCRAGTITSALAMLDAMAELHQASWRARGRPGSFATPFFHRFHRALVADALPRGEVALLTISSPGPIVATGSVIQSDPVLAPAPVDRAGPVIGIVYNFTYAGTMLGYQSGFVYSHQDRAAKPGLTCHHAAIRYALAQGLDRYDFLAGDDRYKRSLAARSHRQMWTEAGPTWSPRLLLRAGLGGVRRSGAVFSPARRCRSAANDQLPHGVGSPSR